MDATTLSIEDEVDESHLRKGDAVDVSVVLNRQYGPAASRRQGQLAASFGGIVSRVYTEKGQQKVEVLCRARQPAGDGAPASCVGSFLYGGLCSRRLRQLLLSWWLSLLLGAAHLGGVVSHA